MRHPGDQHPEGSHLVGLDELHLLLARRLFEAFAFRQVPDNAGEIVILVRYPTRERDLQWKFLGVLAQAHHFDDAADEWGVPGSGPLRERLGLGLTVTGGEESCERRAQDLVGHVAE